jgi:hypothetical protein
VAARTGDIAGQAGTAAIVGASASASAGTILAGTGKRIVLADDNADMREYVRRLLLAQGYAVDAVGNGEEAKVEGLDAGADDYLIKPFAARELLARVSANIQMARMRAESAREVMRSEQRFLMTNERLNLALSTGRIAVFELDVESGRTTVLGPLTQFSGCQRTMRPRVFRSPVSLRASMPWTAGGSWNGSPMRSKRGSPTRRNTVWSVGMCQDGS